MEEKKYYCRVCGKELEPKYDERIGRKIVGHHTFNIFEYEDDAVCCSDCWPFVFHAGTIQEFINDLKHYSNEDLMVIKKLTEQTAEKFARATQKRSNVHNGKYNAPK